MSERQRRLAAQRQRRHRARRDQEFRERLDILKEKRAQALISDRPDLAGAVTSDQFATAWRYLYDEAPPDLTSQDPDVIEYRLEAMADDLQAIGVDLDSDCCITVGRLGK